jgi:hypothetical protein
MKRVFFIALLLIPIFILVTFKPLLGQQWTEPVNISNLGGYSMEPDMIIDNKGVIHVVWDNWIGLGHWLIMYSCSNDDGATWSEPLDLLQNTDYWMAQPHIACNSNNKLYVVYTHDYNGHTTEGTVIKMINHDGLNWGQPFIISKDMPSSHYGCIVFDHNDRAYVFWDYELTHDDYYTYLENNTWKEPYCPYPGGAEIYALEEAAVDKDNSLHWIGASKGNTYPGQERLQYYYYNNLQNCWYPPVMPVKDTIHVGRDIALSNNETLESTYRKKSTISVGETSDSTMLIKKEGDLWGQPILVSGTDKRQVGQQIVIDQNNDVHIVETEYYVSSSLETELVHYYNNRGKWIQQRIDYSDNLCNYPKLIFAKNKIYVVYWWHNGKPTAGHIRFSKYDIITDIKEESKQTPELKIYPNPGSGIISIEFENNSRQLVDLAVYDINGKLVSVLTHKMLSPGMQRFVWDAHSTTGQKVKPGTYLVKLTAGDNTATQVVEIVK